MLHVVLADDEPSVLEGLRMFVTWEQNGFSIIGEAADGEEALRLIASLHPDLVICDIRMPGLSGIQLMERVQGCVSKPPKFLVLSGYADFTYAQRALALGALGYLTKPLDAEELARELARAAEVMASERAAERESMELVRYSANALYNDILEGKHSTKLEQRSRLLFQLPAGASVRVVELIAEGGGDDTGEELCAALAALTGTDNENGVFYTGGGTAIAVLHDRMDGVSDGFVQRLEERLDAWGEEETGKQSRWILVSGLCGGSPVSGIVGCGRQLERLRAHCLLHPGSMVLSFEEMEQQLAAGGGADEFPALPFDRLTEALKGGEEAAVRRAVARFFECLAPHSGSPRLYAICLYRLAEVVKKTAYAYGIAAEKPVRAFLRAVEGMHPQCRQLAEEMCLFVFRQQASSKDKPWELLEGEIVDYIRKNCTTKLSLQRVAEEFSLSALVVSKLIKQKTGKRFNDYLNSLRIDYAKTLIASENMKIALVCEKAGYSDYGYFTEKFREFAGVLPSEYKAKYS